MIPQIKQRIEQIRRGEVPEGYKKTKVGIVPADWQEHKLSHYLTVNNDKNTDLKYTKDDVFSISGELGIVNQIELLGRSYAGVSVAPYGIVYPNDVVYTKSPLKANPYGIIKTNKLGVTGIVSTLYAIFHCNNNVSPDYVQLYFESDHNLNNYLYPIVNIGAKHDMKISDEGSLRGTVVFPPLPEQEKIAAILQTEDKVIELQQKKIDELKRLKKGYLSKMFPKKGCNVPEIRFPGFTDAWEQRKLSHFLEVSSEKNTDNLYTKDDVLSVSGDFGVVNQIEFQGRSFAGASVSNYGVVHTGDVVYTKSPLKANPYGIIKANKGKTGIVSVLYGVYHTRENANADFVQMYFEQEARLNNYLRPLVNKGAKNTLLISDTDALEGEVCLAPTFDEQKVIGQFFDSLDNLITLHQRKLEEEQKKKKALMQFLLTGIVRVKYDT